MKRDPIRLNLFENTGGYSWQVAERIVSNDSDDPAPAVLTKPEPPGLADATLAWKVNLPDNLVIKWADEVVRREQCRTPLLSPRGSSVTIAVNKRMQSWIEVTEEADRALQAGAEISVLRELCSYGDRSDNASVAASLVRHGLATLSEDIQVKPWGLVIEPFVKMTYEDFDDVYITNLLNGRFLRISHAAAELIHSFDKPSKIDQPLNDILQKFVSAGMLRVVGEPL